MKMIEPATEGLAVAAQRKRTIRLYRIADDWRRLLAGTLKAGSPAELVTLWHAFLATAARGTYAACYRGETLGLGRPMRRLMRRWLHSIGGGAGP